MDLEAILQLIPTYGFPIVMCVYLLKYMKEEREKSNAELKELREVIERNTLAVDRLTGFFHRGDTNGEKLV